MDWWMGLPAWLRIIVALGVIFLGICMVYNVITAGGRRGLVFGLAVIGLGIGMLLFGGKSDSEKKGYHF